jgi:hypothetical protein
MISKQIKLQEQLHEAELKEFNQAFNMRTRLYSLVGIFVGIVLFLIGYLTFESSYPEGFFLKLFGVSAVFIGSFMILRTYIAKCN